MLEDFQLENDANDTFRCVLLVLIGVGSALSAVLRVTFEYYDLGHYWQIVDGKSVGLGVNQLVLPLTTCVQLSFTINLTYAAKWKLIEC